MEGTSDAREVDVLVCQTDRTRWEIWVECADRTDGDDEVQVGILHGPHVGTMIDDVGWTTVTVALVMALQKDKFVHGAISSRHGHGVKGDGPVRSGNGQVVAL